ncbi:hypothetical protein [Brevibacillus sp. HD3.3A]|uniref:hypothetical protein n=1 Tax=Brevibacillus sp. HD3.3A TaxID=2738979 RepID=UPI001C2C095E|nr:hypothetical protein [Brevibacillus sp. HD3.3A]UED72138.1 hypothetical protein HP435_28955 [Brevibacillus sp. HD3.3A]
MVAEWSDKISAFWYGGIDVKNGQSVELIAWKGSHHIMVYPVHEHPQPPSKFLQYHKRIETLEDFQDAIDNNKEYMATYLSLERI